MPGGVRTRRGAAVSAPVQVMGILNVTPDSFSDGGRWLDEDRAIAHGRELRDAGADIIDVGGESTRPGAQRVSPAEEQRRVLGVIRELSDCGAVVSVDTVNASTAQASVAAGAKIINDVSGGLADPEMLPGAFLVLMHWRGFLPAADATEYTDPVAEVRQHLDERVAAALDAGVSRDRIILDPGIGFSKTAAHNWALLRNLDAFVDSGLPVLIGVSRKRFLATLTGGTGLSEHDLAARDAATAAVSYHVASCGGWGVRVHDVVSTVAALKVWQQVHDAEGER